MLSHNASKSNFPHILCFPGLAASATVFDFSRSQLGPQNMHEIVLIYDAQCKAQCIAFNGRRSAGRLKKHTIRRAEPKKTKSAPATNVAETVQDAVIGEVVYVLPTKLPPHVPPTAAVYPAFAVTVNVFV